LSFLSEAETRTLEAICRTLVPAGSTTEGRLAASADDIGLAKLFAEAIEPDGPATTTQLKRLLRLFEQPLFGLLVVGRPVGFSQMAPEIREHALRRMERSRLPLLRQAFQGLKQPALFLNYSASTNGSNPNWPNLGYEPKIKTPPPRPKSIRTLNIDRDTELTADVVVVGSGSGGAVIAAELAASGSDVIVIEKGEYLDDADFTGDEMAMTARLFLRRGFLATDDLSVAFLAGSCLGGGTVVNWSDSLRTPDDVLDEWEREHGLEAVTGADFQIGFDVAERRMDVSTRDSDPNPNNAALQRGCQALGYEWSYIPRNASGCEQRCGGCQYGCPYGCKRSAVKTFLQDAHEDGARFIVGCSVQRVLTRGDRVTGVEGVAGGHRIVVRSPRVVVACGGIESPALLLRSGVSNPNIGRHLRIHPVTAMSAYYDMRIEAWKGSPQTIKSDQFANLRGGYGFRLEVAPAHPGLIALGTAWESGLQHKAQMLRAGNAAVYFVLTRDTGEGSVGVDAHGEPVIHYWPNRNDAGWLVKGMQEITRIAFAGGALAVSTTHSPSLRLESDSGRPGDVPGARLDTFIAAIGDRGIAPNRLPLFSAHQMGTCRLGANPRTSVADPYGRVHGVHGLFIGDASGFPTASGVNPMLTVMALAYRVAQRLKSEVGQPSKA
jgi:choline dehydrogenase-like flavoprotein